MAPTMQDIRSGSLILDLEECLPTSEQADDAEGGVVDGSSTGASRPPTRRVIAPGAAGLNLEGGLGEARIGYELRFGVVKAQPGECDSGRYVQMPWERPQHLAHGALEEDHRFRDSIQVEAAPRPCGASALQDRRRGTVRARARLRAPRRGSRAIP